MYIINKYILMKAFLRWKLGLVTRDVFNIVVSYTERFKDQINYIAGWRVESIRFEDQIFLYINESQTTLQKSSSCSII